MLKEILEILCKFDRSVRIDVPGRAAKMRGNGRSDIIKSFGIADEQTFRCEGLGSSRFLSDPPIEHEEAWLKANPIEREQNR
jgi:hypothetical protein